MKSPIKWTGGKAREIKYFKHLIPDFEEYIEPFFGGGALYWHLQPKNAIINDINPHLINFYNTLKNNYDALLNLLQQMEMNKEFFKSMVDKLNNKNYIDNIEQASIFYYLNKTSFSGKWRLNKKGEYNNTWGNYKKENYKILDKVYSDILQNTTILNMDYKNIMEKCKDKEDTFIFLDPPYLNCDTMYTKNQSFKNIYNYIDDYMRCCECKVMLVVKNDEYICKLFKDLIHDKYSVKYSHNSSSNTKNYHLIIMNYVL